MGILSKKVALVTGGARGIGAAVVKRLSEDGAAVAFTYVASAALAEVLVTEIKKAGGKALAIQADSGNPAQVKASVAATVKAFGGLDILVNNAGIERSGVIDDYSLDDLDEMIAVNIRGVFIATQEALRHMGEGGRIINIGSVSSDHMPIPGHAAYAMTKGAITSLTRGLARDLGPRGITVNNVQPGRIDTDLFRQAAGIHLDRIREGIAMKRFGTTDELAGLVAYLASPAAGFVTGTSLKVDGGASS